MCVSGEYHTAIMRALNPDLPSLCTAVKSVFPWLHQKHTYVPCVSHASSFPLIATLTREESGKRGGIHRSNKSLGIRRAILPFLTQCLRQRVEWSGERSFRHRVPRCSDSKNARGKGNTVEPSSPRLKIGASTAMCVLSPLCSVTPRPYFAQLCRKVVKTGAQNVDELTTHTKKKLHYCETSF